MSQTLSSILLKVRSASREIVSSVSHSVSAFYERITTAQVVLSTHKRKESKKTMLTRLLFVIVPIISRKVAGFFGRFLGSEEALLLFFFLLFIGLSILYHFPLLTKRYDYLCSQKRRGLVFSFFYLLR